MQVGIFGEYKQAIDEIKNRLLQLYNKYQGCHYLLDRDHQEQKVTDQEYFYAKKLAIFTYDPAVNPKYMLTEEEARFVKNYGDFMDGNELSADLVRRDLLDKLDKLNSVGDAIRVFYFLENVNEKKRREIFIEIINNYYDPQIKECEEEIEKLKAALGNNYYASLTYYRVNNTLQGLLKDKDKFIKGASEGNLQQFMTLAQEFYSLDLNYYTWYKKRYINDECQKEVEVTDQESDIDEAQGMVSNLGDKEQELVKTSEEITDISLILANLMGEVISIGIDESEKRKPLFKSKKVKENNKEELFKIFVAYMNYPIFVKYLEQFGLEEDVNLNKVFDNYYVKHYNNAGYIEPETFKKRLLLEAISYLRTVIDTLKEKMEETNKSYGELSEDLGTKMNDIRRYATIRKFYDSSKDSKKVVDKPLLDIGFSKEEIDRIYEDMKNYLASTMTKEYLDGPNLNMKAGN